MSKKKSSTNKKLKRLTFSLEAADAGEVLLMGDFNNWSPKKHPMQKDGSGIWNKTVMLPNGNYEYKFLVDGQWREDPRNERRCANCFGTFNNVIHLPEG